MTTVTSAQRFNAAHPCPICGGFDGWPRGEGRRCHGFLSADGAWAHCSRAESAGGLPEESSGTYSHRLRGDCRCGVRHGEGESARQQAEILATYPYRAADGRLLYEVVRKAPKAFQQRRRDPSNPNRWVWNLEGIERVPYRLPELLASDGLVFITEGEKDVDNLRRLGLVATCNSGGAGKWQPSHAQHLHARDVVVLPDNDDPGRNHAQAVAATLQGVAARVRVVELPNLPLKGDVSDWLAAGGEVSDLLTLVDAAPEYTTPAVPLAPTATARGGGDGDDGEGRGKESQSAVLLRLAAGCHLFHTAGAAYASADVAGHLETWPLTSNGFRGWLKRAYFLETGRAPGAQAVQDALGVLEARALFEGATRPVSVRVAGDAGNIYIDLADATWRQIAITPAGWSLVDAADSPVRFRRPRALLPLPEPRSGGSLDLLRQYVNAADADDFRLMLAWLVAAARPTGPYPVLILGGEQGSSKSTTGRVLRGIIDPQVAGLRGAPASDRDLVIAAAGCAVLAFDNLSGVQPWLSDALCRLATGGGLGTRALYSDAEETLFDDVRPVLLTGIEDLAARADLLDRAIPLVLPPIPDGARRDEATFWSDFRGDHPLILGALCDVLAGALAALPEVHLERAPRMADFARWATAAEHALGWEPGTFISTYATSRKGANATALEGAVIAGPLLALLGECDAGWSGTAADLLAALNRRRGDREPPRGWPSRPHTLSGQLRRMGANLRELGWDVQPDRRHGGRILRIAHVEQRADFASPASPASPRHEKRDARDAERDADSRERHALEPDFMHETAERDARDARVTEIAHRSNLPVTVTADGVEEGLL